MLHVLSLLAALGLTALAIAQSVPDQGSAVATGFLDKTITIDGRERRYVVYVPPGYTNDRWWPLLVFLNGMEECGTDGRKQVEVGLGPAIKKDPARWPFVVVFPQKPDADSEWIEHDALVMGTIAATEKEYRIGTSWRLLTGLSQGGAGTWALGSRHAGAFQAIAPVCGYGNPAEVAPALRANWMDYSIWAFHGLDDEVVPAQQTKDLCAALTKAGCSPVLTLYENTAHNAWDKAYGESNLAEWLRLWANLTFQQAITRPEELYAFRLVIETGNIGNGRRTGERLVISVGKPGDWGRCVERWSEASKAWATDAATDRKLVANEAANCLRDCVLHLVRSGVVDDLEWRKGGDEGAGDYVSLDYSQGSRDDYDGRGNPPWPGRWRLGYDSAASIDAIREVRARFEQLR